eukprot:GHVS01093718.1.p1 GENE.GHVS01093718.1~~GHVS01093718.1.p1  ORF type:complete len:278 (-),score=41.70 GHVS01093718.1:337-1170(-)
MGPMDGTVRFVDDRFVVVLPGEGSQSGTADSGASTTIASSSPALPDSQVESPAEGAVLQAANVLDASNDGQHINPVVGGERQELHRSVSVSSRPPIEDRSIVVMVSLPEGAVPERNSGGDRAYSRAATVPANDVRRFGEAGGMPELATPSSTRRSGTGGTRLIHWSPRARDGQPAAMPASTTQSNGAPDPVPLNLTDRSQKAEPCSNFRCKEPLMSPASHKYLRGPPKCVVCMTEPDEAALDPCGHICMCMDCALKVDICPICRTQVLKVLKIFITA